MPPVAVVADTTAYLPPALLEQHRITLVSLYVNFGSDRTVPEREIGEYDAFFDELRSAEKLPTTSQPSLGDFIAAYEPLLADGGSIVSVHISGGLSGTAEAARQAAETLERDGRGGERIRVIDTNSAAGGVGLVTLAAAHAAESSADLDAVAAAAEGAARDVKIWFAVDTLEFFRLGGRIGAASAWIGSTLKVKPILTCERELVPVERVRTSRRAFERMLDYARQCKESGLDGWCVQHISAAEEGERLVAGCREIFGNEPLFFSEVGAVLATHSGPGMLGVAALPGSYVR
ncbi:MAG: DegV family protein [Thermoleophilaceae bacterium]|nr:DegV family protein [Thermoleophilaceae bacterium]